MRLQFAAFAALLAASVSACTARRYVMPERPSLANMADYSGASLGIRRFNVDGGGVSDNTSIDAAHLRSSFAEYVSARCRFSSVELGESANSSIGLEVVVKASHTASRTWILDLLAVYPMPLLWPLVPQWGTASVHASLVATDTTGATWTAQGTGTSDYSMTFYSWFRTEPVELAYRTAYSAAFETLAKDFCTNGRTIAAAHVAPGRAVPAAAVAMPAIATAPAPVTQSIANAVAGKLAVLDFKNFATDLQNGNVQYFTDVVRGAVLKSAPRFSVMTRENLLVLLHATGKDLGACEGECEVDTGRRIGADVIVSGDIQKVGTRYKISLRMHETQEGRLISTAFASGTSVDALDDAVTSAAAELVDPIR